MMIVDRALAKRAESGQPILVGMVGAGVMGKGVAHQILGRIRGIDIPVICNRHPERAETAYRDAGIESFVSVSTFRSSTSPSSAASISS